MSEERFTERELELARLIRAVAVTSPRDASWPRRRPLIPESEAAAWEGMATAFLMLSEHAEFMAERSRAFTSAPPRTLPETER